MSISSRLVSHHPRSTNSTPFPYTTLFRSIVFEMAPEMNGCTAAIMRTWPRGAIERLPRDRAPRPRPHDGRGAAVDRKSTRLNSSHVSISYAVFCLKKKKKKESSPQHSHKT